MSDINKFSIDCLDGCGSLHLSQFKDDGVSIIAFHIASFYSRQDTFFTNFKKGIKMFWHLFVMGREYQLYEILIESNKKLNEFKRFVSELEEIDEG